MPHKNDNILDNSSSSSPMMEDGKRKISLSSHSVDTRQSLISYSRTDEQNKQQQQQQEEEVEYNQEFDATIKCLHEINSKFFNPSNAFTYNFINYIDYFIHKEKIDFKIIAMSLDAGTKVYISKIDLIYNNTHKISSSLSMATDEQNNANYDEDDDELLDDENLRRNDEKRRKRKKKTIKTIEGNIELLNYKAELSVEIDPLFYHLSEAFDVGNVNALLLANLQVSPNGMMLLDSEACLDFNLYPLDKSYPINFTFNLKELSKNVCKPFSNFEFSRRDNNVTLEESNTTSEISDNDLNFDFDINAEVEDISDTGNLIHSNGEEPPSSGLETDNQNEIMQDDFDILQILPEENQDNQFFNRKFLEKNFKNISKYYNMWNKKKPVQRKRNVYHENDYNYYYQNLNKYADKFVKSNNTILSNSTISKWYLVAKEKKKEFSKIKLSCDPFSDDLLFNFPKSVIKELCSNVETMDVQDVHDVLDDDYNDDTNENVRQEPETITNPNIIDDEPLNLDNYTDTFEPTHVDALDIDYAKVAKKIDIKKVKANMWKLIQREADVDNFQENETSIDAKKNFTFFALRQNLPSLISSNLNENLSTPISFVALLHLCNEKNLYLKNSDNLGNFFIETSL